MAEISNHLERLLEVCPAPASHGYCINLIGALGGLVAGGGIGYVLFNRLLSSQKDEILAKAEQQGENIKEKKILQAKERFIQMKEKHNAEIKERNSNLQSKEDKAQRVQQTQEGTRPRQVQGALHRQGTRESSTA